MGDISLHSDSFAVFSAVILHCRISCKSPWLRLGRVILAGHLILAGGHHVVVYFRSFIAESVVSMNFQMRASSATRIVCMELR